MEKKRKERLDEISNLAFAQAVSEITNNMGAACISDFYGWDAQSRQTVEEMAELTKAINKFWRKDMRRGEVDFDDAREAQSKRYHEMVEEIADVEVCLMQLRHMLECDIEVEKFISEKIERTMSVVIKEQDVMQDWLEEEDGEADADDSGDEI